MGNKFKDIDIKNRTWYFQWNDQYKKILIQKIKIYKKSCKNILVYYIRYATVRDLRYVKISSVNPLHLVINKINRYIEDSNGNKYLTLVPTGESKDTNNDDSY